MERDAVEAFGLSACEKIRQGAIAGRLKRHNELRMSVPASKLARAVNCEVSNGVRDLGNLIARSQLLMGD